MGFQNTYAYSRSHFGIVVYNDKIYCIGGVSGEGITGVNEVYDPATDTWETKTPMPTARYIPHTNLVDGKIYLIGGWFSTFNHSKINEVYNPETDSWTTLTEMPYESLSFCSSAAVNNKIYVMGGWSGVQGINANLTMIYDTQFDVWTFGASQPSGVIQAGVGVLTGLDSTEQIYFFGHSVTQIYVPKNDSWLIGTVMPTARGYSGVAVIDNTFYVIGGILAPFSGYIVMTGATTANEQYIPIEYIPEFPSWTILPMFLIVTLTIAFYRKRIWR